MVDNGQNYFADRAVGIDVHVAKRLRQRRIYLLYIGDFSNADLRSFCLRLGLPRSRASRFVRLDSEKDRTQTEGVSFASAHIYSACRRVLYVHLSEFGALFHETGE